ncbi:hypothetical protein BDZ94DRAFT_1250819 [Collybia nuda]|uniref:DUF6534 domain-containing protein n=1 Tax=Collybia nuda TaxID=64659 RepID=A0A9P5YBB0_9AGAR|nr:hypothetical protein BDZ94DRAFT_1250819 [Collybia nuda]
MNAFTAQVTNMTGPLLLALLINCGLHGVLCVQVHTYYMAFPKDPISIKILVYGLLAIESAQTFMIAVDGFDSFVTHKGDVPSLDDIRLLWFSVPIIGAFVASIGQLFFAYRLRVLSKTWIFSITIAILSVCTMAATLVIAVHVYKVGKISAAFTESFAPALISHLANILSDIEIIITMIYYLSRHTTISSPRLHRRVKRLIRLVLEAGALTTTANILTFLLYIIYKGSVYFVIPYVMIPKLYSITLTFILNNRIEIIGGRHNIDPGIGTFSPWNGDSRSHLGFYTKSRLGNSDIAFREVRGDKSDTDNAETVIIT